MEIQTPNHYTVKLEGVNSVVWLRVFNEDGAEIDSDFISIQDIADVIYDSGLLDLLREYL